MKIGFENENLRKLRISKGYSQAMLCRLLEMHTGRRISKSAIAHWELGDSVPRLWSLLALCDVFGVGIDYFFAKEPNSLFKKMKEREIQSMLQGKNSSLLRFQGPRGKKTSSGSAPETDPVSPEPGGVGRAGPEE